MSSCGTARAGEPSHTRAIAGDELGLRSSARPRGVLFRCPRGVPPSGDVSCERGDVNWERGVVNRERGVASSSNVRGVLRGVTRRRVPRGVMITSSREPAERSERSERAE